MYLMLAVIIFLLGLIAGTLLFVYFTAEQGLDRLVAVLGHLAKEQKTHADASATVLLKERRQQTQAILKELRMAAKERRTLMAFATGQPEEEPPSGAPLILPVDLPVARPLPSSRSPVDPDALTPVSGYPLTRHFSEEESGS